jgi:catechol 2,3-dioxygenase-like lactoylglutathione lyase family enzyme
MKDVGGIFNIAMTVADIERSVEFYRKIFGFEKVNDLHFTAYESGFFSECPDGPGLYNVPEGTECALVVMEQPGQPVSLEIFQFIPQKQAEKILWDRPGYTHIAFESPDFDGLIKRLEAENVEFCMRVGIREADSAKWVFIRDPDGNMIEILSAHKDA